MAESSWRSSSEHDYSQGRSVKKMKTLQSTLLQADTQWQSNRVGDETRYGPASSTGQGKAGFILERQRQVPLLEQYRSALGDLNGRSIQRGAGIQTQGKLQDTKENQHPDVLLASCSYHPQDCAHTMRPSPPGQKALGETQSQAFKCSINHQTQGHTQPHSMSALRRQSGVNLDGRRGLQDSQATSSQFDRAHADKPLTGSGHTAGCGTPESDEEEDDDALLLYEWRSSKSRTSSQVKSRSSERSIPITAGATQSNLCSVNEKRQPSTEEQEDDADCINSTILSLGGQSPLRKEVVREPQTADSDTLSQADFTGEDLERESQDGALSQLLEIADEEVRELDTVSEAGLSNGQRNSAREEEAASEQIRQASSYSRKGRTLDDEERTRFILEASQAALKDAVDLSEEDGSEEEEDDSLDCPICGIDLQQMEPANRDSHTNKCLDNAGEQVDLCTGSSRAGMATGPPKEDVNRFGLDYAPLVAWLDRLQLGRYGAVFVKEEVDFDALHCLKEEDLEAMGIVALGPKRKLLAAIEVLKRKSEGEIMKSRELAPQDESATEIPTRKPASNRRITDFFPPPAGASPAVAAPSKGLITSFFKTPDGKNLPPPPAAVAPAAGRGRGAFVPKKGNAPGYRGSAWKQKSGDPPQWHLVPGTDFRVDAFRFQSPVCRHWFLSHFHADHYQGLTRNFRHGTIFCSSITARLVNMKLGVPLEKLHTLPLNERVKIDNCHVTLMEANHCPGAVMFLFEPEGAKPTLHTGDFRYCPEMASYRALQGVRIGTLILDTTYCDPQYDFPKQDTVVQFVIDAIQAETFNPKTLFLIGSYTIGKEKVFLEVARELNAKVYVGAARRKVLACLELPAGDMARLTTNESESNVHVVPLWSLANFKRMASIAKHYQGRYNTFVSFSPTGWSFGRGKKRTTGTRKQQGTIVRYEVPYSEHSSFSELRTFVRLIRPANILPHVNNDGGPKAEAMIAELLKAHEPDVS